MHAPTTEQAYLFHHVLARDAAYELQLPNERAQLHQLAFELIEHAFGGRAPEPPPVTYLRSSGYELHAVDAVAGELANHLRAGGETDSSKDLLRLYLRRAGEHAERVYHNEDAVRTWRELAKLSSANDRAVIMIRVGDLVFLLGRMDEAERAYRDALEIARELDDTELVGAALDHVAVVCRDRGQYDLARKTVEEALELHKRNGNQSAEAGTLGTLASLQHSMKDYTGTKDTFERALALARASGSTHLESVLLANIGLAYLSMDESTKAEELFEQSLQFNRNRGERLQEGIVLSNLARLYHLTDRAAQGAIAYRDAIEIHREVGNRRFEGMTLCDLALCQLDLAQVDEARRAWKQGVEILQEIGDRVTLACLKKDLHEACTRTRIKPFGAVE
jgi:tetratricopeptide (TPR) repeat protein